MNMKLISTFFITVLYATLLTTHTTATAAEQSCTTQYPIVLSHHWGLRKICPDDVDAEDCELRESSHLCTQWIDDGNGGQNCAGWQVPVAERHLPPRDYNIHDSNLTRDLSTYHRYYSADIVNRLETFCGVPVYVADKPAYASNEARARSLRNTVLLALEETNASKVNIIGMSQGSQDSRYMIARLPVSDSDPSQGLMRDKVASLAGIVGEHRGALGASLILDAIYFTNVAGGDGWGDYEQDSIWANQKSKIDIALWQNGTQLDLMETPKANEQNLDEQGIYRHYVHSVTNLSRKYMYGQTANNMTYQNSWPALIDFVGDEAASWEDLVNASNESANGVEYFSWAAKIRIWDYGLWSNVEAINFFLIWSLLGDNDGYATVNSQRYDLIGYPNMTHVKTLKGSWLGRGYHHMFFSGRNDDVLSSGPLYREDAPYDGGTADFYEQVARHLANQGF